MLGNIWETHDVCGSEAYNFTYLITTILPGTAFTKFNINKTTIAHRNGTMF